MLRGVSISNRLPDSETTPRISRPLLLVPSGLAVSHVLTVFADSGVVLEVLPRPVIVAVAVTLLVQALLSLMLRSANAAAIATTLIIVALLDLRFGVVSLAILAVAMYVRFRVGRRVSTRGLVAVALALLTISTIRVVASPASDLSDLGEAPATTTAASFEQPDVFVILLDAYPRTDTLAEWGYDNRWFEEELDARGFDVAPESHSNYSITSLVVPSMLYMRHVDEIADLNPPPSESAKQHRAVRSAVLTNPVLTRFDALAYATVSAGMPGWAFTLKSVDRYIDGGHMTWFEYQVVAHTMLGSSLWFLPEQHRERVLSTFDAIEATAARPESTFMFAHVMSPHMPLVLDRDGEMPKLPCDYPCRPFVTEQPASGLSPEAFYSAVGDQVHGLNGLVLSAIDAINTESPDAVVVIFSDHGLRSNPDNLNEFYSTFFAARTPGHHDVFPDDARPIEIFPRIFNAYFGDDYPIPDDRSFHSPNGVRFPLTTVPADE